MLSYRKFVCLSFFIVAGCDTSKSDRDAPIPTPKALPVGSVSGDHSKSKSSDEPKERLIGGIKFEIPGNWEDKALSNTMILHEFSLPGENGSVPGRLTFSTAAGGTEANLNRWKDQFLRGADDAEPNESPIIVAGKDATLLELHGSYSDSFSGTGPKSNWQLLGVAIPIDAGHNYFLKLTGPQETVSARREEFLKFVRSARFE